MSSFGLVRFFPQMFPNFNSWINSDTFLVPVITHWYLSRGCHLVFSVSKDLDPTPRLLFGSCYLFLDIGWLANEKTFHFYWSSGITVQKPKPFLEPEPKIQFRFTGCLGMKSTENIDPSYKNRFCHYQNSEQELPIFLPIQFPVDFDLPKTLLNRNYV